VRRIDGRVPSGNQTLLGTKEKLGGFAGSESERRCVAGTERIHHDAGDLAAGSIAGRRNTDDQCCGGAVPVIKRRSSGAVIADPEGRGAKAIAPGVDQIGILMIGDIREIGDEIVNQKCIRNG